MPPTTPPTERTPLATAARRAVEAYAAMRQAERDCRNYVAQQALLADCDAAHDALEAALAAPTPSTSASARERARRVIGGALWQSGPSVLGGLDGADAALAALDADGLRIVAAPEPPAPEPVADVRAHAVSSGQTVTVSVVASTPEHQASRREWVKP